MTRERQATAPEKNRQSFFVEKQYLAAAPLKGRRPGYVLYAPCRGFSGRPWFDALFFGDAAMAKSQTNTSVDALKPLPALPLDPHTWRLIVEALRLSPRQAKIVELILRSAGNPQIATVLGISEPTVKTHVKRIFIRTGVRDRMELAMHVLAVSHRLIDGSWRHPTG